MRSPFRTLVPALAALALWACGGGDSSTGPPDTGGTVTPSPPRVEASCDTIQDIESYRYSITLRLEAPAFQQPDEATPNPLSEFAEALADLFRDMELEGAFVAPDRSQAVLRFHEEELELRTIGDKSWIRVGATWQEQEPPGEDVILTPASVCADLVEDLAPSLAAATGEEDVVNGIETIHYHLDEADLKGLPELLGRSGEEGLPSEFGVDVWLERSDGWPVRLEITASDVDEGGEPISLELFMEFSDIDDPTIEIEPPPVSPAQT
ncbi:MAG: hypothetical protein E3J29_07690 [Dehalococcoidia bacterium]|nr:MAG: hypothetical protein E3J29_07690 [Dehalococcoidia bacterium]